MDKASSSADEDNCDYNKVQSRNKTNKKKGEYFHATLLFNDMLIKTIIDSRSPVTLIPQGLFNDISEVTKLKTSYKVVNFNQIEFWGPTKQR